MNKYDQTDTIAKLINEANTVLIMQADNPDGDSLGSSLALEQILSDLGKNPVMYCGVNIPSYLQHLAGWDRVQNDIPNKFDISIIVDTSSIKLFDSLERSGHKSWVATKPCIVLDHHPVEPSIPFATTACIQPVVATGELIYELAQQLNWNVNTTALEMTAVSILSDSLGLTSEATTPRSVHIIGEILEKGVSLAKLDNERKNTMRKSPELIKYKGELLQRIEYFDDNRVATITIPHDEIVKYGPAYNPSMLVIDEMRMTENTKIAIAFKTYNDGKVTAKIRCNYGYGIANDLAKQFGGGGHVYASGFKITDGRTFDTIKTQCVEYASKSLANLKQQNTENEDI